MLGNLSQSRLEEAAQDAAFLAHLDRVQQDLHEYLNFSSTWYRRSFAADSDIQVAYFSMEFGLTDCLPIYSGGLGILAGDHLKSASDLGVPLVGVGLLYQKGYFRQYLNAEGWQQESDPIIDFYNLPLELCRDGEGRALRVSVDLGDDTVIVQLWRARVGRIELILLDTNLPENAPPLQDLTDELYGGDVEMRVRQEIILGIGGVRALEALEIRPRIYHMNEGHSAFLALERTREFMAKQGLDFPSAWEMVKASCVFTTHTPVPAGIDLFGADLIETYFGGFRQKLGLSREEFFQLGRVGERSDGSFNMAALALRATCFVNGVSQLHGHVSRMMWREVWPDVPLDEIPIAHITNGVHVSSWISADMASLYDRYLGPRWAEAPADARAWMDVDRIPGEELWRTHERRRKRMVAFARRRLRDQLERRGAGRSQLEEVDAILDPEALTIGFARRFATYKRATLLLRDPARLARILNHPERPAQIIFAGKAHPRDDTGKALIRELVQLAARPEFRRRIVFLENYDTELTRYLVEGVDVWLNTPRRPFEASGTSGMKAAFNGALNLSIPDGWWNEAYHPGIGWAIGAGESYVDPEEQDTIESGALYELLEREVVPLFYRRAADGQPREWIAMMTTAMRELCPVFNSNRMVQQYVREAYRVADERRSRLAADEYARGRALAAWRRRVAEHWPGVRIENVETRFDDTVEMGDEIELRARIQMGNLLPEDLSVEAYLGSVDERQQIVDAVTVPMHPPAQPAASGTNVVFQATVRCQTSGRRGLTIRVLPYHPDLPNPVCERKIQWAR
jgi:starch phosphorylase